MLCRTLCVKYVVCLSFSFRQFAFSYGAACLTDVSIRFTHEQHAALHNVQSRGAAVLGDGRGMIQSSKWNVRKQKEVFRLRYPPYFFRSLFTACSNDSVGSMML